MRVRATQPLRLGPGTVLTLSEQQAGCRRHALSSLGGNRFRALAEVCFKAGEEFGVDEELPKALADVVETDVTAGKPGTVRRRPAGKTVASPAFVDPARLDIE